MRFDFFIYLCKLYWYVVPKRIKYVGSESEAGEVEQSNKVSFTKPKIEQWNESNTVKYDGLTIGEFQVHNHRSCFKFRFQMANLLMLLEK